VGRSRVQRALLKPTHFKTEGLRSKGFSMSKLWTVISIDRESGTTKNHMIMTGFDTHVAESKFREDYPNEDLLALISGKSDLKVYDSPRCTAVVDELGYKDPEF